MNKHLRVQVAVHVGVMIRMARKSGVPQPSLEPFAVT
jgi:hypothetical protein